MKYIDLHSDTFTMLHYPKEDLLDNKRMVSIPALQDGEAWIQCFSAFVPTGYFPHLCRDAFVWKRFCDIADKKDALLEHHSDVLVPVESWADVERLAGQQKAGERRTEAEKTDVERQNVERCTEAEKTDMERLAEQQKAGETGALEDPAAETRKDSGKIGVIFTGEDLGVIGSDLRKLDTVYQRGVRIATLTWNHENAIGFPNSAKPQVMQAPLKPFGTETVEKMNELGIVIDVSHLSDGGFWDVAHVSSKPFIATHSNSREITNNPRNLTDAMIKAIAKRGGVIGINFAPQFLSGRGDDTSRIRDILRHIRHIRNVGGSDVLAIGTDFDGIRGHLEIDSPAKMPLLAHVLTKCGMKESELEKIFYKNALRVFREVWREK